MATSSAQKSIVFFHPDLGIGGAERLVIDAAVGLQQRGHKVTIYTSYCDPNHCFDEARDGTLDVRVRGNSLVPSTILGRFSILCAILRQLHLVLHIAVLTHELDHLRPTHFFIDQLSACVPLLRRLYHNVGILFYCHFPDQLLVQKSRGWLGVVKEGYRVPFNALESWSTGCSDGIVVNSNFTGGVVKGVFPQLKSRDLKVVYPCVDTSAQETEGSSLWPGKRVLLSINRFERKKDVALAVRAFAGLNATDRKDALLVIAGGYDPRVPENVSYHADLEALATSLKLSYETHRSLPDPSVISSNTSILFLLSVPNTLKQQLLASASLLIYTPRNEHFGIVPLEAMLAGVPVLAANEGGPLETVVENRTGWLRDVAQTKQWTDIMQKVLDLSSGERGLGLLRGMGENGRARVKGVFSKESMAKRLDESLDSLASAKRFKKTNKQPLVPEWVWVALAVVVFACAAGWAFMESLFWALKKDEQWQSRLAEKSAGALRSAATSVPAKVREEL